MRHYLVLALLAFCSVPALAQQPDPQATVTVGTAVARRGQTAYGEIVVPAGSDSGLNVPVAVINGTRPGPVVSLMAGTHGAEYASIVALTRIIGQLDPKAVSGTIIVAPLINVPSFDQMITHVNPVDGKAMNAPYPGDPAGTQSQRVLAAIAEQVIRPAAVIVDLHGGDLDEDLQAYSYWYRTGNAAQDSASRTLVLALGVDHVVVRDLDLADPASRRSLAGYAMSLGKRAVVAESGRGAWVTEEDLTPLLDGVKSVLGALNVIDHAVRPVEHPVWLGAGQGARSPVAQMFYGTVGRGTYVSEGMRLGFTTDYLGRPTGDVKAPISGVVTFIRAVPSAWKNATLVSVAAVLGEPGPYVRPTK